MTEPQPIQPRARSGVDIAVTIILLVLLAAATLLTVPGTLMVLAWGSSCYSACNTAAMSVGAMIAGFGPLITLIITMVLSIVRLSSRRRAWWVPLAGSAAAIVCVFLGWEIYGAGIG